MWIIPLKNGRGRVYPTHVGGGFFSQIYRLWFVGGKHSGEDVAGHDEGGGHLCLNLYKIFTEEWLTGVVEKGGEEDAAVAPQRGGHVRLPQHHQSLWT